MAASSKELKSAADTDTFPVPYLISTQPDGSLPDMQGFDLERVGSVEGGWYSLCPIKAGRALAKGETISACLVHRRTGELTRVDYTAKAGKLDATKWLADFAEQVAKAGKPITAGGWSEDNAFSSSHATPRLWCQADYRAFSTAPFSNNCVQVLACDDNFSLAKGKTLSLQVRDLKTQALHEQHLFTAEADSGWSKTLCAQINRDSLLLRAGVLDAAACTVTPGDQGNAFWGPQHAELCVTLTEVDWWACDTLDSTAIPSGGPLHAWVYDAFSHRLLGHHTWTPSKVQSTSDKWLKPWAEALAKSQVAPYLRINTTTAMLEQRGDGLRIFATLPGDEHAVDGPVLKAAFKAPGDAVLVTVRHPGNQALLHHALFRPQDCKTVPGNQTTWVKALSLFIQAQNWPELSVKDDKQLWLPRHAELLVALDNVGDGGGWSTEDYGLQLLNTDEWPSDKTTDSAQITVEPAEGVTGVTINSEGAELAFRLDEAARKKGYRVMACVPRQEQAERLRETYNAYVDACVAVGTPIAATFAEVTTLDDPANVAKVLAQRKYSLDSSSVDGIYVDSASLDISSLDSSSLDSSSLDSFPLDSFSSNLLRYCVYTQILRKHATVQTVFRTGDIGTYENYWKDVDGKKYARFCNAILRDILVTFNPLRYEKFKGDLAATEAEVVLISGGVKHMFDSRLYTFLDEQIVHSSPLNTIETTADTVLKSAYKFAETITQKFNSEANVVAIVDTVIKAIGEVAEQMKAAISNSLATKLKKLETPVRKKKKMKMEKEMEMEMESAEQKLKRSPYEVSVARLHHEFFLSQDTPPPVWPVSVTGDTITWQGPLANQTYDIYMDFPESERGKTASTVGHIGTLQATQLWHAPQSVSFHPAKALKEWKEISFLCEDYANTSRSELFDTTGHSESGVDPRTGLFHAHYPVASLQGLQGQGPACDLTLHYSALRANEAGLGDGWAWRFSSVQVRDRLLTLADGTQVKFTDAQWADLGKGQALKLASCVVRSNENYSEFTLDLPSGRQEILKAPAAKGSDDEEPNKEFHDLVVKTLKAIRDKSKPDFPTTPENWQQWLLMCVPWLYYATAAIDYNEAVKAWEGDENIKELKRRIAEYEKPFVLLLPSTIESPYGEQLTLEWKRQKGQFLLLAINSGDEALFTAEYVTPQEKKASQVKMQVWPGSKTEKYEVNLDLKGYLLRTLKREQNSKVLQQVDCDYDDDPTLDRVLCGLRELDGSVECVKYQAATKQHGRPGLPRVKLHTLLPGDGHQNQVTTYRYDGEFLETDQRVVSVEYEGGAHGAREQHLLVHGRVKHGSRFERFELLRGVASEQDHWLAFSTRKDEKKGDKHRLTKGYRYTGAGDEFVELCYALEAGAESDEIVVKDGAVLIERQQELLEWLLNKSDNADRPKLAASITRLLAGVPRSERDALGRTVEVATQEEDLAGNIQRLHKSDEHTLYRCYYTKAGDNPITLNTLKGLEALPTLNCPFIPDYAAAPLMAEYQCDPFGNPKGLRLFGYRKVKRGTRDLLEQAEVVVIEGVKAQLKGDRLDADATWALAGASAPLLWRQRSTEITGVSAKTAQSKVMQWSVKDTQVTHLGQQRFELKNVQDFEDNPTNNGIVVRVNASTEAGTEQLSKELRSRHARRRLERVEQGEEVHWQYDALGRVTQETRYLVKAGGTGKDKDQKADEQTDTTYSADGKVATHTHANKDISRSYLDGLQRVWRREWRKHGTQHYVPLEQCSLQGLDASQLLASCTWDYLPGGQAVVAMAPAVLGVGPQAWTREQGGLDGPGLRSVLQAKDKADAAQSAWVFEALATQDITSQCLVEHGLDGQCLFQRSTDYTYRKNGTFEQVERLIDTDGKTHMQLLRHFDSSGHVIKYERTLGKQIDTYSLERDALGRVTQLTRPNDSTVAYSYHGLSNHATELKVDGTVVATQKVSKVSTLTSRTVGKRAYGFTDTTVTLPDKTILTTAQDAKGMSFKGQEQAFSSLTHEDNTLTLSSDASDSAMSSGWTQAYRDVNLPGRQQVKQTSPRATRQGCRWQSLRGQTLASLRADGHWQREFTDRLGRVLRTCQDHEEVLHRYDALGRLQSRQAQALKAGGRWQVLSEYDSFGQEVTRRFLHNGSECFKQCLTWRGDGRLASKTSYEKGTQLRAEHFTYDALDRLQKYECKTSAAKHCPQDSQGTAVKAQDFTWDAMSNLTQCVTTDFDDKTHTEDLAYAKADPTQLTGVTRGKDTQKMAWNSNGYLTDAAGQHRFSYNAAGQLDKVHDSADKLLARYEYDGSQRLAAQYLEADKSTRELRYDGDELIGELRYDKAGKVSQRTSLTGGLAQYDENEVRWLIDDPQVGVAGQVKEGKLELAPLLPFGEGKALTGVVNGYNGMRRDPLTGHYHAGNGYRTYNPALRRYAQPDWLSPFGEGGINDYAHCPDPVNLHDPSGAIMISRWDQTNQLASYHQALQDTQKMPVGSRWRGLAFSALVAVVGAVLTVVTGGMSAIVLGFVTAMSVLSFAFEVTAVFTADSNPELSRKLSIVSVATGVLSTLGFSGLFKLGLKGLKLLATGAKLLGKGAKVVWNGAKTLWRNGLKGLSGTGRAARAGGRFTKFADNALGGVGTPDKLGSPWRRLMYHLTEPVEIYTHTNFAHAGAIGKIGSYMQAKGLHLPLASRYLPTRISQGAAYAADVVCNVLDANLLQGTILSSIGLEEQRLALQAEEQPERAASVTISVRNAGDSSAAQVPRLPSIGTVRHRLPPATHSVRFWW
ncbi:RHS repeat-associated core domain-containing protein [Pseudomonas mosselii]|uniref:RHS repeat-associated core domain-containing protein n=1 Tax=Pseudomonas mosselii TaxID=78327 RepID=UPI00262CE63E|nr:RHS repeat-associated core domain-containing protein [Pseudomonas mosselii]MDN4497849.1 RHS repeat-associated core domain-containing protein [Pseudomonas mosselii]